MKFCMFKSHGISLFTVNNLENKTLFEEDDYTDLDPRVIKKIMQNLK